MFVLSAHARASVEMLTLEHDGIIGTYYKTAQTNANNPILVLGGSEGGIPEKLAKSVADAGHATLAVAYFNKGGLPTELEEIPLEYFEKAKGWLQQKHPEAKYITLVGWSKGAELSLLLASKDPTFNRVVAIAPSSVVWAGILKDWQKVPSSSWTEGGSALPFVSFNPTGPVAGLRDLYAQSLENRNDKNKATISVQDINGDVVLYSGGKDEIWPSSDMAKAICENMAKNNNSNCSHFDFPGLRHLLDYKFLDKSDALYTHFTSHLTAN